MDERTEADPTQVTPTRTSEEPDASGDGGGTGSQNANRRRRSRGGRGRGRRPSSAGASSSEPATDAADSSSPSSTETSQASPTTSTDPGTGSGAGSAESTTDAATSQKTSSQRRRRRGGRGRGGSKATAAGAASGAASGGAEGADADDEPSLDDPPAAIEKDEAAGRRSGNRRRRGSGRRATPPSESPVAKDDATDATADEASDAAAGADGAEAAALRSGSTRRRRSRSRGGDTKTPAEGAAAKPGARTSRRKRSTEQESSSGVATVTGPTRLRRPRPTSGRTRIRRQRDAGIIIPPRVTDKLMVITEHGDRDQIAVLEDRDLVQHYVTRMGATSMVGNVYLGRVQNVLPGMEAAFVDVGRGRNAVLYAGEVNYSAEELDGDTPPRIEEVLKSGQSVLVQVTKDPMGGKGARLTAQISMPGRYLVLVPDSNVFGISRRIPDEDRKRLKAIAKRIKPEGSGLIIRTAAEGATEEQLTSDLERVRGAWDGIQKRSKKVKAPAVLYEEPELTVRVVRDLFTDEEYRELVTDSPRIHELVTSYLKGVAPDLAEKVRIHRGTLPAFEEFHVVEQIHKALDRKVWLPSGGYLIIERTEAMTVIDVNTGKSVGKTNLEETVVNTNLEAAREVARQLRLRDIGGIIIIDFIDMLLERNKHKVVDTLRETMAQDKTRSQVFEIGPLGLLEVTRKRVSGGLVESFSETCPTCEGRGILLNYES